MVGKLVRGNLGERVLVDKRIFIKKGMNIRENVVERLVKD